MDTDRSQKESVLLVEGDPEQMSRLRRCFEGFGFGLDEAGSVAEAVRAVRTQRPSLVMSEIVLPDASGFSLCRLLREDPSAHSIPVVLLSRWSSEADRILAFHCGADDFVAKPYFARELASRVQAVLRRSRRPTPRPRAPFGSGSGGSSDDDLGFRVEAHGVRIADRFVDLTPREHALLVALMQRQGRVMSRRELIEEVWAGEALPNARNIDAHVKSLRRKLGLSPGPIETVRGIGYRFARNTGVDRSQPRALRASR